MKKRILCFIMLFYLIFALYTMVFSQNNYNKIDVSFKDIVLKGQGGIYNLHGETFYYNNKLYAPVSNVIKALGGEGILNKEENEITIRNYKDFPECNSLKGEIFAYGMIMSIDYQSRELEIEQYLDDNSIELPSKLEVKKDVNIVLERNDKKMNLDFADLKAGDRIGLILDIEKNVRAIILSK